MADVSIPTEVSEELEARGLDVNSDNGTVSWQRDSPSHPRMWSLPRKAYDSALICFLEFFMSLVSNTGSSIADEAAIEFGISNELAIFCFVTLFLLGQAVGVSVLAPVAESFGGRTIYVASAFTFAAGCLIMTAAPNLATVIVGRFISGLVSSTTAVVAAGSIENMWDARARIWIVHLWMAWAVLGLTFGPPVATYISTSSLRWYVTQATLQNLRRASTNGRR